MSKKKKNIPASILSLAKDYPTMFDLALEICKLGPAFSKRVVEVFSDASGIPVQYLKTQRDGHKLVTIRLNVTGKCGLSLGTAIEPTAYCCDTIERSFRGTADTAKTLMRAGTAYRAYTSVTVRKSVAEAKRIIALSELLSK